MLFLRSRNIIVSFYFIFFVTCILNTVIAEINVTKKEFIDGSKDCVQTFHKTGSYSLEIIEVCDIYHVNLELEISTSIINLTTSIKYQSQDEDFIKNASDSNPTFNIRLYESTTYFDTGEEKNVLLKEWRENTSAIPCFRNYLSRSSKVFIEIWGTGNLSYYEIKFSFDEIGYRLITLKPKDGNEKVAYRPNSVSLLRLHEPQMTWKGIEISFDNLDIDAEMGEYILIGTGTEPFKNTYSRPLYISEVTENTTFFVDNPSAFVAFVSGPVQKEKENFKIVWKGIEEKIDIIPEDPMGVLNSSLICFYNYSAVIQEIDEFKKDKYKGFEMFRRYFAETAKEYLPNEYKNIDLNKRSIDLFGNAIKKSDVLYIPIKVMYKRKSIFTWSTLQSILEKLEENSTHILGYKVGKCPQNSQFDLPYKDDWVFYALVPVLFGLFALMMWAWKHNLFAQNCLTEKQEKATFSFIHAEPNEYGTTGTIPKVCRFDDDGRRETLIQGSSQEDREGAEDTTMVEMNMIPSTSQDTTLKRFLSSSRKKSRTSLNALLDNAEKITIQSKSGQTEGNESDHLYDSVCSSQHLGETKL